MEHCKLAPRGKQGVFIGLGISHGSKCWLAWSPRLNHIFASRHLTFDETLFPLRNTDQRVYGVYDNHTLQQMREDIYNLPEKTTAVTDILNLPLPPVQTSSDITINPILELSSNNTDDNALSQACTQLFEDSDNETGEECSSNNCGGVFPTISTPQQHTPTRL